jgi:murein DD-endopeptidase MepM/ murein hydrolase activator NlpD
MLHRKSTPLLMLLMGAVLALAFAAPAHIRAQSGCGPSVMHVVERGQTMFRIALRYGTTVSAIASANGIANPNLIFAGQSLRVPCAGSVTPAAPTPTATPVITTGISLPTTGSVTGGIVVPQRPVQITCAAFRATSPTDGMDANSQVFYWNPAPGATGYRLSIFNLDGGGYLAASFDASATATRLSTSVDSGAIGTGFRFSYYIEALFNGVPVCRTQTVTLLRAAPTAPPPAPPTAPAPLI